MPRTTGVVLTRSERIPPRPSGPAPIAVAVLVVVAHLGLLSSAVLGLPVAFAVLAVACTALEPVAERVVPLLPWALSRFLPLEVDDHRPRKEGADGSRKSPSSLSDHWLD